MKNYLVSLIIIAAAYLSMPGAAAAQVDLVWSIDLWPYDVIDLKFFPSGDKILNIATNYDAGNYTYKSYIQVRLTENGQQISPNIQPHPDYQISSIDVSPDGRYIAAAAGGSIIIYDATTYQKFRKIDSGISNRSKIRFSPDGKYLLVATDRTKILYEFYCSIFIWDIETGALIREIKTPVSDAGTYLFDVSPSGNYFAVAQVTAPGKIWIYDMITYEKVREYAMELTFPEDNYCLHFSKDGNWIGCLADKKLNFWGIQSSIKNTINGSSFTSFNFSNKSNEILISRLGNKIDAYDFIKLKYTYQDAPCDNISLDNENRYIIGSCGKILSLLNYKNPNDIVDKKVEIINYSIYPNPITNQLLINFYIEKPNNVSISISDINGKSIQLLKNTYVGAGEYNYSFLMNELSNGIYNVSLKIGKDIISEKILINK